ncbi:MAG: hypothetical protein J6E43_00065 [Prevotella sp.]|nr:hypothetical protein [Prevotella sp.]
MITFSAPVITQRKEESKRLILFDVNSKFNQVSLIEILGIEMQGGKPVPTFSALAFRPAVFK